jgi:Mrp family chromosome partitioning ATPase
VHEVHDGPQPSSQQSTNDPSLSTDKISLAFKPAWEVDRFIWPAVCERLYQNQTQYLHDVGARLGNAANEGLRVLGLTSAHRGSGKTTMALCLARSARQSHIRVALVDADFNHPHLRFQLGLEDVGGWEKAVQERRPLTDCAIQSIHDSFVLLPLSATATHVPMRNAAKDFASCLQTVAEHFDLVIVDMGTFDEQSGGLYDLGPHVSVDAVIVVRDSRCDDDTETWDLVARIKQSGIDAVGIADNFQSPDQPREIAASA